MTHISSIKSGQIHPWLCACILFGLLAVCGAPKPDNKATKKTTTNATTTSANENTPSDVSKMESAVNNDLTQLKLFVNEAEFDSQEKVLMEKLISIHQQINQLCKVAKLEPEKIEEIKAKAVQKRGLLTEVAGIYDNLYSPKGLMTKLISIQQQINQLTKEVESEPDKVKPEKLKAKSKEIRSLETQVAQLQQEIYASSTEAGTQSASPTANPSRPKNSNHDWLENFRELFSRQNKPKVTLNKDEIKKAFAGLTIMAEKILTKLEMGKGDFYEEMRLNGNTAAVLPLIAFTALVKTVVCSTDDLWRASVQAGRAAKALTKGERSLAVDKEKSRNKSAVQANLEEKHQKLSNWCAKDGAQLLDWVYKFRPFA